MAIPDVSNPPEKAKSLGPLAMIFREAKKYPLQVLFAALALLVTATITSLALPSALRLIIDRGFTGDGEIGRWFRYLLVLVGVLGLATALRFYFVSWLGERVVADIRRKVYDNLLRLSPSFFEENSPKEISSRMVSDTAIIEQVVGTTVSVALRNVIMAILATGYLFWLAPQLAVWLLVGLPAIIIPITVFGRRLRNVSRESQDRVADVGGMVTETLSAMKIVQGFNQEAREGERFGVSVERTFAVAKTRIMIRAVMTAMVITLVFGGITALLWRGAVLVTTGEITGGTIGAFVFASAIAASSFGALTEVLGDLLRGAGAASRLSELMDEQPVIEPPARPQALPQPPRGSLAFQNVSFSYPTRPGEQAIVDFNLTVEPGETVAIVGPSGAGKSTILNLIPRFYDPEAGSVTIDGQDLRGVTLDSLRHAIALVSQEILLFDDTVRANIAYGRPGAGDAEIEEAARMAGAHDFITGFTEGYDTQVGPRGSNLSGGQRQRIAIARAMLKDAPILLLDEATSALDSESERHVQRALGELMKGRTTFVIAHRLSTVVDADLIYVIEDGQIIERGSHAELLARGGHYARLYAMQFAEQEDGAPAPERPRVAQGPDGPR